MGKRLTIGVLAHVDAGKTTFCEQLLYHTNSIRKRGRVDHQDAFLDSDRLEKERGITIFSNHAAFEMGENRYFLLDTPGHMDFSAEMERAISAMDYAVLVVSCVEGIQAHTEQVWKLLKEYEVPTFFFLNKTDRTGADAQRVFSQLQKRMSAGVCDCSDSFEKQEWKEELIERVAAEDDGLLERYLEGEYDESLWCHTLQKLVKQRKLFPCFQGSALQDEGIDSFLTGLDQITCPKEDDGNFAATVWQIRHDTRKERVTFLKVQSGILHAREEVDILLADGTKAKEKVNELRIYHGTRFTTVQQVYAGELCAVTGFTQVHPGDRIGEKCFHQDYHLVPMLGAKVIVPKEVPLRTVLENLRKLEDEDPMLGVSFEESLQEIQIRVMGEIQLEVLREVCKERFSLDISFGDCQVLYRETIAEEVVGYGHYEPLRHYAEVHLRLSPAPRGSGISFDSECPTDILAQNWQNLVRTHVFEKKHKGVLTGSELCDVKVTLLTGRSHLKHTEGGDFREATYRAIRQGLEQLLHQDKMILLEPYYAFSISLESEQAGRLMADLQRMECSFGSPQMEEERMILEGRGPAAVLSGYGREFISYTRGKGVMSFWFDGYESCKHQQEIVERIGYQRERDLENPSCSVFCSHGAGFPVPWDEVQNYIHCK